MFLLLLALYIMFDPVVLCAIIFLVGRRNADLELAPVILTSCSISLLTIFSTVLAGAFIFEIGYAGFGVGVAASIAILGSLVCLLLRFCSMSLRPALAASVMYGIYRASMPFVLALIAPLPHC